MNPAMLMRHTATDAGATGQQTPQQTLQQSTQPPHHAYYNAASPAAHAQNAHHHAPYPPQQSPPHATSPMVSSSGGGGGGSGLHSGGLAAHSNLYIAGIPHSWSLAQLEEYFGAFGPISESRILMDKITQASRGIAFVRYAHMDSAKLAIQHCHGTTPPGGVEKLVVKPATDKNTLSSMHPSGYPSPSQQHVQPAAALPASYSPLMQLPMHTSPAQLLVQQQAQQQQQQQQQQHPSGAPSPHLPFPVSTVSAAHFLQQQQLPASALSQHPAHSPLASSLHSSLSPHSSSSPHVVYTPSSSPLQLRGGNETSLPPVLHSASHLPYLSSTPLASRPAQVYTAWHPNRRGTPQPGVQLFVFHLPPEITNEQLVPLFAHFGHVLNCAIMRDPQTLQSKGFGFVTFKEERDAEQAIRYLNGFNLGNKFLKVEYKVTKGGPRREGEPGRNIYANTNPNGRHHQAYQASLRQQQQQQERLMRELAKQQQHGSGLPLSAADDPLSPLSPQSSLSQGSSPAQPSSAGAPFDAHNMSAMLAQLQQLTVSGGAATHKPLHASSAPNTPFVSQTLAPPQPHLSSNNASLVMGNYTAQQQQQQPSHPSPYLHAPSMLSSPSHHAQSSSGGSQQSFSSPLLSSLSPSSVTSGVGGFHSAAGSASQTPVSSQPSSSSLSALAPRLNSPGPLAPLPPAALIQDQFAQSQQAQYAQQTDAHALHATHQRTY